MKILFLVSTLERTGPTQQLLWLATYLKNNNLDVKILTLSDEPSRSRLRDFEIEGIPVSSLHQKNRRVSISDYFRLRECILIEQPDIIQSQGIRSDFLLSLLESKYVRISTLRNFPLIDYKMAYGPILGRLLAIVHYFSLRRLTWFFCVSQAVQNNINSRNRAVNCSVIRNGVDVDKFNISPDLRLQARNSFGFSDENRYWVYSGSLIKRKNVPLLIKSWLKLNRELSRNVLVIAGSGPELEYCRKLVSDSKSVIFLGEIDNLNFVYNACDYFISLSLGEGFPNSVLEALSCGLPCVLSDIEPHKEVFDYFPNSVLLVNVFNPAGSSVELNFSLLESYRLKRGQVLRMRLVDEFSSSSVAKKYFEGYMKILNF